ncbi:MAG: PmoA family protein [Bacteroidales bacterium]
MKRSFFIPLIFIITALAFGCAPENGDTSEEPEFKFIESYKQIHVLANGEHFTSYLYDTTLMKPVLYPVYSSSQIRVQRQYPLKEVEGENHDHPHHVGVYFTYGADGEVNGNNYWQGQRGKTRIRHKEVTRREAGPGSAVLATRSHWIGREGDVVLVEDRTMEFTGDTSHRAIDFTFNLKAEDEPVSFEDTKEGMFAIRVANWLTEEDGDAEYLSSEGERTSGNIWGKRAEWVRLEGSHEGKDVGIIIMNHPSSVNYPCYWHARGYGLFGANPLGRYMFEDGRGVDNPESLNYEIPAGESGLFRFKMIIYEGHRTADEINEAFDQYSSGSGA